MSSCYTYIYLFAVTALQQKHLSRRSTTTSRRPKCSWSYPSIKNWKRTTSSPAQPTHLQPQPPPLPPRHRRSSTVTDSRLWFQQTLSQTRPPGCLLLNLSAVSCKSPSWTAFPFFFLFSNSEVKSRLAASMGRCCKLLSRLIYQISTDTSNSSFVNMWINNETNKLIPENINKELVLQSFFTWLGKCINIFTKQKCPFRQNLCNNELTHHCINGTLSMYSSHSDY